jgi:hypothetical protein
MVFFRPSHDYVKRKLYYINMELPIKRRCDDSSSSLKKKRSLLKPIRKKNTSRRK